MTQQETFDKVVAHARKQGCKSQGSYIGNLSGEMTHGCTYRGQDNTACFAGALIPNDQYKPEMEGLLCTGDNDVQRVLLAEGHQIEFVRRLQTIHDCYEVFEWEEKFKNLAAQFDLVYTPPAA